MNNTHPVTITQIAKELNISIGTVDRALHNRPGINPQTKAMVLQKAKEMNYEVNILAQALSRRNPLRIGVLLPSNDSTDRHFYTGVEKGIKIAASELQDNRIEIIYQHVKGFEPEAQYVAFSQLLEQQVNGIIFNAADQSFANDMICEANSRNIPSITIGTDAPGSHRLCFVTCDSYTVGCIAGELMCNMTQRPGQLIIFTGYHRFDDNKKKVDGFVDTVNRICKNNFTIQVVETYVADDVAYKAATRIFEQCNNIVGIYINTANSPGVCKRINEIHGIRELPIIATDLFPELRVYLMNDTINVTIFQNPVQQGKRAVQLMYEYLASGKRPNDIEMIRCELLLKSTLKYFPDII